MKVLTVFLFSTLLAAHAHAAAVVRNLDTKAEYPITKVAIDIGGNEGPSCGLAIYYPGGVLHTLDKGKNLGGYNDVMALKKDLLDPNSKLVVSFYQTYLTLYITERP